MSSMEYGNLAYLGLLGAVLVFWVFVQNRESLGKKLQQMAAWGLIFLGTVAAIGLWDDIRQTVRLLRQGEVVWYAPDQDYGTAHAVFVPFFGIPAATITATSRIAKMGKAAVIPCAHYRLPGGRYEIEFGAPLDGFPSGDEEADTARINQTIEHYVRKHPEQYLWVHKRFKHQPPGQAKLY